MASAISDHWTVKSPGRMEWTRMWKMDSEYNIKLQQKCFV